MSRRILDGVFVCHNGLLALLVRLTISEFQIADGRLHRIGTTASKETVHLAMPPMQPTMGRPQKSTSEGGWAP